MKSILIKPLITEKTTADAEVKNCYGFIVATDANKIEIRQAVQKQYGVSVTSVRTLNYDGKAKSRYTRTGVVKGRSKSFKKAIVQVKEGDIIDFYDNI